MWNFQVWLKHFHTLEMHGGKYQNCVSPQIGRNNLFRRLKLILFLFRTYTILNPFSHPMYIPFPPQQLRRCPRHPPTPTATTSRRHRPADRRSKLTTHGRAWCVQFPFKSGRSLTQDSFRLYKFVVWTLHRIFWQGFFHQDFCYMTARIMSGWCQYQNDEKLFFFELRHIFNNRL